MRNPKNSWHLSDSIFGVFKEDKTYDIIDEMVNRYYPAETLDALSEESYAVLCNNFANDIIIDGNPDDGIYVCAAIGPKDMDLAKRLISAGPEHRKFLRQIFVSVDITAPLYWWKEFDTYKIGTTANSTSTMHKLTSKPITLDCFEIDDLNEYLELNGQPLNYGFEQIINYCEALRQKYIDTNDKKYWKELVRWLPESWLQTRTVTMNYENLLSMVHQRKKHKLTEWSGDGEDFVTESFIKFAKSLPYAYDFIFIEEKQNLLFVFYCN